MLFVLCLTFASILHKFEENGVLTCISFGPTRLNHRSLSCLISRIARKMEAILHWKGSLRWERISKSRPRPRTREVANRKLELVFDTDVELDVYNLGIDLEIHLDEAGTLQVKYDSLIWVCSCAEKAFRDRNRRSPKRNWGDQGMPR